jgi:hypothetical protein
MLYGYTRHARPPTADCRYMYRTRLSPTDQRKAAATPKKTYSWAKFLYADDPAHRARAQTHEPSAGSGSSAIVSVIH